MGVTRAIDIVVTHKVVVTATEIAIVITAVAVLSAFAMSWEAQLMYLEHRSVELQIQVARYVVRHQQGHKIFDAITRNWQFG